MISLLIVSFKLYNLMIFSSFLLFESELNIVFIFFPFLTKLASLFGESKFISKILFEISPLPLFIFIFISLLLSLYSLSFSPLKFFILYSLVKDCSSLSFSLLILLEISSKLTIIFSEHIISLFL